MPLRSRCARYAMGGGRRGTGTLLGQPEGAAAAWWLARWPARDALRITARRWVQAAGGAAGAGTLAGLLGGATARVGADGRRARDRDSRAHGARRSGRVRWCGWRCGRHRRGRSGVAVPPFAGDCRRGQSRRSRRRASGAGTLDLDAGDAVRPDSADRRRSHRGRLPGWRGRAGLCNHDRPATAAASSPPEVRRAGARRWPRRS